MTRHLSDNLPPPLSSESRPEGHPYDGLRTNKTAVSRSKFQIPFKHLRENPTAVRQYEIPQKIPLTSTPFHVIIQITPNHGG